MFSKRATRNIFSRTLAKIHLSPGWNYHHDWFEIKKWERTIWMECDINAVTACWGYHYRLRNTILPAKENVIVIRKDLSQFKFKVLSGRRMIHHRRVWWLSGVWRTNIRLVNESIQLYSDTIVARRRLRFIQRLSLKIEVIEAWSNASLAWLFSSV